MRAHMKVALYHINKYGIALSIFVEERQRIGHFRHASGIHFPKQHTMPNSPSLTSAACQLAERARSLETQTTTNHNARMQLLGKLPRFNVQFFLLEKVCILN